MADIEYTISGDASDLIAALEEANLAVSNALAEVSEAAAATGEALDGELGEGAKKAGEEVKKLGEETSSLGDALGEIKEQFKTAFELSGLALAYEESEKFIESLKEAGEAASSLATRSEIFGVTTDRLQAMDEIAKENDVSAQQLSKVFIRLSTDIDQAFNKKTGESVEKLHALGIATNDIIDRANPLSEAIMMIHNQLENTTTAEKEKAAILENFGKYGAALLPFFKEYNGSMQQQAAILNIINAKTGEQNELLDQFHKAMVQVGSASTGSWNQMLAGALKYGAVAGEISSGDMMSRLLREEEDALKKKTKAKLDAEKEERENADEASAANLRIKREELKEEMEADKRAVEFFKEGTKNKMEAARTAAKATLAYYDDNPEIDKVKESYAVAAKAATAYSENYVSGQKAIADASAEAQEKVVVANLESAKKILEIQSSLKQIGPEQNAEAQIYLTGLVQDAEVRLYRAKEAALIDDGHNNDQNAAARKTLEEQITSAAITASNQIMEIHHKETEELNKDALAQSAIRMQGVKQAEDIAIQQAKAQQKAAATQGSEATDSSGVVRDAQMQIAAIAAVLVAQQDADAKEAAENQKLLDDKTIDANENAKRMAALTAKEVTEVAAASSQIEQLNDATAKKVGAQWKQAMSPIASNFTSMFDGMLKGTETFRSGMIKIADSILSEWEKSMITVPLEQWAARMSKEVALKQASEDAKNVIGKEGQAQGLLESVASAIKERANNASLAATSMWAQAPNPIIGGIEAAAAFAAVMAFPVSSAKGGMMVDEDQMAMVHENEMILPSDIRKGIEQKILNNNTSNENSSTNHFSINSMDAKSFEKYLSNAKNRNVIANAVNTARMRGNQNVRRP